MNRDEIERRALVAINAKIARSVLCAGDPVLGVASWVVAKTRVWCEERTVRALPGIEIYLPRLTKTVKHARRISDVVRPLFDRHFFARITSAADFAAVRHHRDVVGVLGRVTEAEIGHLRAAEGVGAFDYRRGAPTGPKLGERVEIAEGPFKGWVCEVAEEADDKRRVGLLLKLLGSERVIHLPIDELCSPGRR
jgi:transcriptional antiterminator RfaH